MCGRPGQPGGEPDPGEETQQGQAGHQAEYGQAGPAQSLLQLFLRALGHHWTGLDWTGLDWTPLSGVSVI